jgi:trehalose 6-phosphate phosphatase
MNSDIQPVLPDAIIPPVQGAPNIDLSRSALFFDIDGTLLDIALTPEAVLVPADLAPHLAQLAERCDGALALVSGRTLRDIDRLFAPFFFPASGGHGAEFRAAAAPHSEKNPALVPDAIKDKFIALAQIPGVLLEDKGYGLALHYRLATNPAAVLAGIAALEADVLAAGYAIIPGKQVFELKPAQIDKGRALRHFMTQPPFAGRIPVFAGDDMTDHDALAALADFGGIGISVGGTAPHAHHIVSAPDDVRAWIKHLCSS